MNNQDLEKYLLSKLPGHQFQQACTYLFSNPGKLFRSNLIEMLASDLQVNTSILPLAAFVEIHHTYSLIHDDLPAMDNDDLRRKQASTHIKYGEATAILAGDALINASYACIAQLESSQTSLMLKLCSWACGAKGLIAGQYFDLKEQSKSFEEILRIHELKTSRLFQICTIGTMYLSSSDKLFIRDFMRLGSAIGLLFQVLDDFKDRGEKNAEFNNLFVLDYPRSKKLVESLNKSIKTTSDKYSLNKTLKFIEEYSKSLSDQI